MTSNHAQKFLESLQRFDLGMLLSQCEVELLEVATEDPWGDPELVVSAVVRAPSPISEALKKLPPPDRKRIAEAIASRDSNSSAPDDIHVEAKTPAAQGMAGLLAELLLHREMMTSVATGDRIQGVDDYYRAREARIRQTLPAGSSLAILTKTFGHGIGIGAAASRNTRIGGTMSVSCSVLRLQPSAVGHGCPFHLESLLAGTELTERSPKPAFSLKSQQQRGVPGHRAVVP
jgi:hypothetical protein